MGLKEPLLALLIAPNKAVRRAIARGEKQITIREGHRDYRAGRPVMLCCEKVPWAVMVDIVEVTHTKVAAVTEEEMQADGYADLEELLAGLRKFYPWLDVDSPVTVIRWDNVRGKLVDNER